MEVFLFLGPFVAQEMSSHSAEALSKQQQPPVAVIRQEASLHSDPLQNSLMPGGGHSQLSQGSLSLSQDDKSLPGEQNFTIGFVVICATHCCVLEASLIT